MAQDIVLRMIADVGGILEGIDKSSKAIKLFGQRIAELTQGQFTLQEKTGSLVSATGGLVDIMGLASDMAAGLAVNQQELAMAQEAARSIADGLLAEQQEMVNVQRLMASGLSETQKEVLGLTNQINPAVLAFEKLKKSADEYSGGLLKIRANGRMAIEGMARFATNAEAADAFMKGLRQEMAASTKATKAFEQAVLSLARGMTEEERAFAAATTGIALFTAETEKASVAQEQNMFVTNAMRTPYEELLVRMVNLSHGSLELTKDMKLQSKATGEIIPLGEAAAAVVKNLELRTRELNDATKQINHSLTKEQQALFEAHMGTALLSSSAGAAQFTVLSFSQTLQDAAQFSNGAAAGVRAITNNVQVMFQSMLMLVQMEKGWTNAMKAMRTAMMGPLGLLAAFSLVSAAIEYFTQKAQQAQSATKKVADAFREAADAAVDVKLDAEGFPVLDLEDAKRLRQEMKDQSRTWTEAVDDVRDSADKTFRSLTGAEVVWMTHAENRAKALSKQAEVLDDIIAREELRNKMLAAQAGLPTVERFTHAYEEFLARIKEIDARETISMMDFAQLYKEGEDALEAYLKKLREKIAKEKEDKTLLGQLKKAYKDAAAAVREYNASFEDIQTMALRAAAVDSQVAAYERMIETLSQRPETAEYDAAGTAADKLEKLKEAQEGGWIQENPMAAYFDAINMAGLGVLLMYDRFLTRTEVVAIRMGELGTAFDDLPYRLSQAQIDAAADTETRLADVNQNFFGMLQGWFNNNSQTMIKTGQMMSQAMGGIGQSFMTIAKTGEEVNEGLFETGKKFAIANAIINTATGITRAFADLPWWAAIPAAIAIAAQGAAQIATIANTQPGSKKTPKVNRAGSLGVGSLPDLLLGASGNAGQFVTRPGPSSSAAYVPGINASLAPAVNIHVTGTLVGEGRELVAVVQNEVTGQKRAGRQTPLRI